MNKKTLILGSLVVAALLAGSVFLTLQKRGQQEMIGQNGPNDQDVVQANDSVPTNWKTYSNKDYGFEIKYPGEWIVEEFLFPDDGLPNDCRLKPETCRRFSVALSSGNMFYPLVFEVSKKDSDSFLVDSLTRAEGEVSWEKSINGNNFVKKNTYIQNSDSCLTVAKLKHVSLKKEVSSIFYTFYEPGGATVEKIKQACSKEIPDETFDKIVGSFTVLP